MAAPASVHPAQLRTKTRYRSSPATGSSPSRSTTDSQVPGRYENRPPGLWTAPSPTRLRATLPFRGPGSGAGVTLPGGTGGVGRHPVGGGEDGGGFGGVAVLVEGADGLEPEPADGEDQEDGHDQAGHG